HPAPSTGGETSGGRPGGTARPGSVFLCHPLGVFILVFLTRRVHLMARSWLQRLRKKSRPLPRSGCKKFWRRNRFVPNLEALGGRIAPAVFHVTTLTDGVAGSLRDAVTQANTHAGADTIVFESGLTGTIALTGGELDVTDDAKFNGPGADR